MKEGKGVGAPEGEREACCARLYHCRAVPSLGLIWAACAKYHIASG